MTVIKLTEDEIRMIQTDVKKQLILPLSQVRDLKAGDDVHFWTAKKVRFSKKPIIDKYHGKAEALIVRVAKWGDIKHDDREARLAGFNNAADMRQYIGKRYSWLKDETDMKLVRCRW